jgi:hypothetical protein
MRVKSINESFRGAAKRRTRNPVPQAVSIVLDSGFMRFAHAPE